MLQRAGRKSEYVRIGLDSDVCYNPLHNDLDPYAVAYAIATLLRARSGACDLDHRPQPADRPQLHGG